MSQSSQTLTWLGLSIGLTVAVAAVLGFIWTRRADGLKSAEDMDKKEGKVTKVSGLLNTLMP